MDVLAVHDGFPRWFGHYVLLTSFGRGGMGEVFLAKQRIGESERLCVVKTLRGDLVGSREFIGRFRDEARVVVQLNHPHISQLYETGISGSDHFLTMEFIHGLNLRELLATLQQAQRPLDAGLAMHVASVVLDALAYAHRLRSPMTNEPLRLVHRDVSPANVMVGFEGDVKLIDFGLAESTLKTEHTETRTVMGKVAYMSPEQARGDDVDASCDQFAAAVMLYECIVGDRFYGDWNAHQIWQVVGNGGFVPRRWLEVPELLRPVLARALDANAARRFPDCDAFRDAVDDVRAILAPRANKAQLRELLTSLYRARIDDERALVARFAHVAPPDPAASAASPTTNTSGAAGDSAGFGAAMRTDPFLTSGSRPAGLPAPGPPPGRSLDDGWQPRPTLTSSSQLPIAIKPELTQQTQRAPRTSASAHDGAASSSVALAHPGNSAARNVVFAGALALAAIVGGVAIVQRDQTRSDAARDAASIATGPAPMPTTTSAPPPATTTEPPTAPAAATTATTTTAPATPSIATAPPAARPVAPRSRSTTSTGVPDADPPRSPGVEVSSSAPPAPPVSSTSASDSQPPAATPASAPQEPSWDVIAARIARCSAAPDELKRFIDRAQGNDKLRPQATVIARVHLPRCP